LHSQSSRLTNGEPRVSKGSQKPKDSPIDTKRRTEEWRPRPGCSKNLLEEVDKQKPPQRKEKGRNQSRSGTSRPKPGSLSTSFQKSTSRAAQTKGGRHLRRAWGGGFNNGRYRRITPTVENKGNNSQTKKSSTTDTRGNAGIDRIEMSRSHCCISKL